MLSQPACRQHVLLTGATGALGPSIAAELLCNSDVEKLTLLVRPMDDQANRLAGWLPLLDSEIRQRSSVEFDWRNRLEVVAGDVASDALFSDPASRKKLGRSVTTIIHGAADTQFSGPFDHQHNVNVKGVSRLLDFARAAAKKPRFVQLSTICTSGALTGTILERPHDPPPRFINQYEQTKWQAERLLLEAPDVPVAIARVGIVIGSHASGAVHRLGALHYLMRWISRGAVPALPGLPNSRLDIIASETVSSFIGRVIARPWEGRPIWHVAGGTNAPRVTEICDEVFELIMGGRPARNFESPGEPFVISPAAFEALRARRTAPADRMIRQALGSISTFVPGLAVPRIYDTTEAERAFGGRINLPDWRETLAGVVRACHLALPAKRRVA